MLLYSFFYFYFRDKENACLYFVFFGLKIVCARQAFFFSLETITF